MPPPNTPVSRRSSSSTIAAPQSPNSLRGTPDDIRSLEYITAVDENLICPVCRVAFIDPITTSCDHVFCRDCFDQSYRITPICPIDRCSLVVPHDIRPTHRLILNQLDALEVRCPNTAEGCEKVLARSMVHNHLDKYCGHSLVGCPDKGCEGKVFRKDLGRGCLHFTAICLDCEERLLEVDMETSSRPTMRRAQDKL